MSEKKMNACAVLIASSFDIKTSDTLIIAKKQIDPDFVPKFGNLPGLIKDVEDIEKLFQKQSIKVQKAFKNPKQNPLKEQVLKELELLFSEKTTTFKIIYYTGHGTAENGSWCFEKYPEQTSRDYLSFKELETLWKNRQNKSSEQKLIIISDSCHSGYFVSQNESTDIFVQSSCMSSEWSYCNYDGSVFTQWWAKLDIHSDSIEKGGIKAIFSVILFPILIIQSIRWVGSTHGMNMNPRCSSEETSFEGLSLKFSSDWLTHGTVFDSAGWSKPKKV